MQQQASTEQSNRIMTNVPVPKRRALTNDNFWWLVGYLQGDGSVDKRNGIWFTSTDLELIQRARSIVRDLFRLSSSTYVEPRSAPWKPKLRLAVYSRALILWFDRAGLTFGRKQWKPPDLPAKLFCHYLAGLFDAEGQIMIGKNKFAGDKIRRIVIHSVNKPALETISAKLRTFGADSTLLERNRVNKPRPHYELRIHGRQSLAWFVENAGRHSCLRRKKQYMREEYLRGN